jgi:hypothetical protein
MRSNDHENHDNKCTLYAYKYSISHSKNNRNGNFHLKQCRLRPLPPPYHIKQHPQSKLPLTYLQTTITATTSADTFTVYITASTTLTATTTEIDRPTSTYSLIHSYAAPTGIDGYHPLFYVAQATSLPDTENICAQYSVDLGSSCYNFFIENDSAIAPQYTWYCGYYSPDSPFDPNLNDYDYGRVWMVRVLSC